MSSPSPFVRLLQAKKHAIDRRLSTMDTDESAEVSTLVGFAAAATNGVSDKPQAISEILFMLVLMFAEDKLSAEDTQRKAFEAHTGACLAAGRIDKLEKMVVAAAEVKPPKENAITQARDLLDRIPDGRLRQSLTVGVAITAQLYALRYFLMIAVLSPHSKPLFDAVAGAILK